MRPNDALGRAAARAALDPFYLASALAAYRKAEGLDEDALAQFLGCPPAELTRLALCRKPGIHPQTDFASDVAHLAARFGLRAERLANLLRQVDFLEAAAVPSASDRSLLLAARDRDAEPATEESEPEDG